MYLNTRNFNRATFGRKLENWLVALGSKSSYLTGRQNKKPLAPTLYSLLWDRTNLINTKFSATKVRIWRRVHRMNKKHVLCEFKQVSVPVKREEFVTDGSGVRRSICLKSSQKY